MLTVCSSQRANIETICNHWWMNEGYERNCSEMAEDLAIQTPVQLNLLLSVMPESASTERSSHNINHHLSLNEVASGVGAEMVTPIKCHSTSSIIDIGSCKNDMIKKTSSKLLQTNTKKRLKTPVSPNKTSTIQSPKNLHQYREKKDGSGNFQNYK